jgi:hypothetical protein
MASLSNLAISFSRLLHGCHHAAVERAMPANETCFEAPY